MPDRLGGGIRPWLTGSRWEGRSRRDLHGSLLTFAAVAALYLLVQLAAGPGPVYADSYDYGRVTYGMMGQTKAESRGHSIEMLCRSAAASAERARQLDPLRMNRPEIASATYAACIPKATRDVTARTPRYTAIFDSRPGYPFVASLFARIAGVHLGLWAASLFFTVLGAGLVMLILARLGTSRPVQVMGAVLYLALPTGVWSAQLLSEGAALATVLLVLLGNVLLLQGRIQRGALISCVGYVASFAVKSSQGLLFALLATCAALAGPLLVRRLRHRGSAALVAVSLFGAAGTVVGTRALGWPGARESLQDTFTNHFTRAPVADPWRKLLTLNEHYWHYWFVDQATHPLLLVCVIVAAWNLWRWRREYALVLGAAALTGLSTTVSHPLDTQTERLFAPMWLVVVFGIPVAVHALTITGAARQTDLAGGRFGRWRAVLAARGGAS